MKKYWLLPVLAMGMSLGLYSCNKSGPGSGDPQPLAASTEEEDGLVGKDNLPETLTGVLTIAQGGDLDIVVRTVKSDRFAIQLVRKGGAAHGPTQLGSDLQGRRLANCVAAYLDQHPQTPVVISGASQLPRAFAY